MVALALENLVFISHNLFEAVNNHFSWDTCLPIFEAYNKGCPYSPYELLFELSRGSAKKPGFSSVLNSFGFNCAFQE